TSSPPTARNPVNASAIWPASPASPCRTHIRRAKSPHSFQPGRNFPRSPQAAFPRPSASVSGTHCSPLEESFQNLPKLRKNLSSLPAPTLVELRPTPEDGGSLCSHSL